MSSRIPTAPEEHDERQSHIAHHRLVERDHRGLPSCACSPRRILVSDTPADQGELGAGHLDANVGSQPRHGHQKAAHVTRPRFRIEGKRKPNLRARFGQLLRRDDKALGHHADDRERFSIQCDRLTDDVRIASVSALPEPVAQDYLRLDAARVRADAERATEVCRGADHAEEIGRDVVRQDLQGLSVTGEVDRLVVPSGYVQEGPALESPLVQILGGDSTTRLGPYRGPHHDLGEPLGLGEVERSQQHGIDHGEHRRGSTDAKPERRDRDRGEARALGEGADTLSEVVNDAHRAARFYQRWPFSRG